MRVQDFLHYHARCDPERLFAADAGRAISYREAAAHVDRLAAAMIDEGLVPGARVALLARNRAEYLLWLFACAQAGVRLVPLNFLLTVAELEWILRDCAPQWLVSENAFVATVDALRMKVDSLQRVIGLDADTPAGWHGWTALQAPADRVAARWSHAEDDLYIMYTSGTTGRPKGAVHTQRALLTTIEQLSVVWDLHAGERQLVVAPLFHAAASIMALCGLSRGGSLVIHARFEPQAVVDALHAQQIDRTGLVPAMIHACLYQVVDVAERGPPPLRSIIYGASAIDPGLLETAMHVFGCGFIQGFGQTESNTLTILTEHDHQRALDGETGLLLSAGRAVPGTQLRIVDPHGGTLPAGEIGEIVARGEHVMRGYWRRDEATASTVVNGWLHTGDAGYLDAEGYLYIKDRLTDMIVSGGENVYPREVEAVLAEHPAVSEVAVIGLPDPRLGEAVTAVVVAVPGTVPDPEELVGYCAGRLARYKQPRAVRFVEALPRNATGKVLKRELRQP